jgi:hypothetical protein
VSGNTATANIDVDLEYQYAGQANYPFWLEPSVQFSDRLSLDTKPGDLLVIDASYATGSYAVYPGAGSVNTVKIGPGTSTLPEIVLVSDNMPPLLRIP